MKDACWTFCARLRQGCGGNYPLFPLTLAFGLWPLDRHSLLGDGGSAFALSQPPVARGCGDIEPRFNEPPKRTVWMPKIALYAILYNPIKPYRTLKKRAGNGLVAPKRVTRRRTCRAVAWRRRKGGKPERSKMRANLAPLAEFT